MLVWSLFIAHKAIMVFIGIGMVMLAINRPVRLLTLLVAIFLITQAVFGRCIVTMLENIVRTSHGYMPTSNEFILHNINNSTVVTTIFRLLFFVLGTFVLMTTSTNK